jgi:hypothetical protein
MREDFVDEIELQADSGQNIPVLKDLARQIHWHFDEVAHEDQLFDSSSDVPILWTFLVVSVLVDVVPVAIVVISLIFPIDLSVVVLAVRDAVIESADIPIDVLEVV